MIEVSAPSRPADFAFFDGCRVRWADVDMQGEASARFDDLLRMGARIERFGRTSFRFRIAAFRDDDLLADVRTTYVCATPGETRATLAVPPKFIEIVDKFEKLKPERG
jgi:acyl-CoA thioesterase FadM